jgi:DNA-binding SARP family transcriptional activator/WD40 repeat protein
VRPVATQLSEWSQLGISAVDGYQQGGDARVMGITVLGPTQVAGAGTLSPRDRVVLGVLVANRGASVAPGQLADALWGEAPPDSWRKVVQTVVMRLRKVVGASAIETTSAGYQLKVAPADVDAWCFADLVDHARALAEVGELDRAVYALDDALAQWHGEPLEDLDGWPLAAAEVARLRELRRLAEEQRLEALVDLSLDDEAIATATALAVAEPLRERRWELLALALYRSGRQGEALRALSRARLTLREELGVEPRPELVALEQAILNQDRALAARVGRRPAVSERCPYKGLESYDVDDAESFFGRDIDVAACRQKLAEAGTLVVTGGSGSGKSSLVRAGLVTVLRAEGRAVAICVPGADPTAAVAAAVASAAPEAALVVDQAEELFTVCTDAEARNRFVDAIAACASTSPVVIVLRADHVGSTAAHPALRHFVEDGLYLLGAMTEPQLREAIEGPARLAGLRLEPGLVDLLVRDVVGEPGALPLLSHALAETWARREGRVLTVAGYRDTGGVQGAVATTAERLYEALPSDQQATTRAVLLRLVEVGEEGDPVPHRLPRAAIVDDRQRHVIDTLLRARLLTAGTDSLEIAHEALARAWPRLRGWLDEDREGQRIRQHLSATAEEWDALERDPTELYRGARLDGALQWARSSADRLAPTEQQFLDASVAAQEEEVRGHRRVARRLRIQVAGLTVLLVVALVAAGLAVVEQGRADDHASRADAIALAAQVSDISTLARTLPASQVDLALLLGVESHRLQPAIETEGALETALARTPPGLERVVRLDSPTLSPGIAADGRLLAVPRADGTVRLLSVPSLEEERVLRGRDGPAGIARFNGDGSRVAVGGVGGSVHVWDVTSGRLDGAPLETGGRFAFGFFDPADPIRLFTVAADGVKGTVVLWDRRDSAHPVPVGQPYRFEVDRKASPVATISSDGSVLAAGSSVFGSTAIFDVHTHARLREIPGSPGEFVPGTRTLATTETGSGQIQPRDAMTGLPAGAPLKGFDLVGGAVAITADGARLAAFDGDRGIRVFDLGTRSQVGVPLGLDTRDLPVGFLADGRLLTSGGSAIGIWRVGVTAPPFAVGLHGGYPPTQQVRGALVAGTDDVITESWEGEPLLRWDASSGALHGPAVHDEASNWFSVSPDGKYLAAPTADYSRFGIWSVATGERVATFDDGPPLGILAFWSPRGDMVVTGAVNERFVVVWDVSDPRRPVRLRELVLEDEPLGFPNVVVHPWWSVDGRLLAVVDYELDTVTVFDAGSGRRIWSDALAGDVGQVAFSPEGETLAVVSWDADGSSILTLWEIGEWDRRRSVVIPGSRAVGVEFLRGGEVLLTTSEIAGEAGFGSAVGSSGAQLWDAATLEPVGEPLLLGVSGSGHVDRDAEGDRAIIGSGGGTLLVWDLDVDHWEDMACDIAGRNLTRAEWVQYLPGERYHATCKEWPAGE